MLTDESALRLGAAIARVRVSLMRLEVCRTRARDNAPSRSPEPACFVARPALFHDVAWMGSRTHAIL